MGVIEVRDVKSGAKRGLGVVMTTMVVIAVKIILAPCPSLGLTGRDGALKKNFMNWQKKNSLEKYHNSQKCIQHCENIIV